MDNNEKIQSFSDMVNAVEKLTRPWKITCIVSNILWAVVVTLLVCFAYLIPADMQQEQDFTEQSQTQYYGEGVTQGD